VTCEVRIGREFCVRENAAKALAMEETTLSLGRRLEEEGWATEEKEETALR
jgi:hypothetical protein